MALVELSLIAIVISLFYIYLTWNFDYWKKRGVLGPKPFPYFGTYPQYSLLKKNILYEIDELYQKYRGKSPFIGVFIHRTPQLLVLDVELIKRIHITDFRRFQTNEAALFIDKDTDRLSHQNPFILTGDEWKSNRSELTPVLTPLKIKPMYPIISDISDRLIRFINGHLDEPLNAQDITSRYTADVISNCVYGMNANAFEDESSEFLHVGRKVFESSVFDFLYFSTVSIFPFLMNIYKRPLMPKSIQDWFINFTAHALDVRERVVGPREDFLQFLLQQRAKKNLSLVDVTAHTITFLLDGFETSSIVIAHALHQLAKNKHVQKKLREEIKSFGPIDFDNIDNLTYLDQVFNETLRIMPAPFATTKVCTQTTELPDHEGRLVRIEEGTSIQIPVYSIHHDPEFWTNPDEFIPERFDEQNGGAKAFNDQGIYFPFGNGPRRCLGMRFAYPVVKTAIAEIVRNLDMTLNSKTPEKIVVQPINFIMFMADDIFIDFKKID